ncbi:DUF1206 domain-containing protein [Pleurocapsales cyanobacterium LEGE 10410]|nr:DUF1206 domain-containing protein [Pleurocapsales cyanobacterium LEGE 10410]
MTYRSPEKITNPWLKRYILIGYAAKGTIYLLIGVLVVQAAIISRQEATGTYLSLTWLASHPLGKLFVFFLAIALMGYVIRRLLQAIYMPGSSQVSGWKRFGKRVGYIMSGFTYTGVAYSAMNIVFELGEHDDTIEDLADELFEQPLGEWLIFLGGVATITIGIFYIFGAYTGSYISEFESAEIHRQLEQWSRRIGKIGVAARGVSFVLSGALLIQAAIVGNSELAGGLQNVFRVLATRPLGLLWLLAIGVGLIGYGLYMFVASGYRRYALR